MAFLMAVIYPSPVIKSLHSDVDVPPLPSGIICCSLLYALSIYSMILRSMFVCVRVFLNVLVCMFSLWFNGQPVCSITQWELSQQGKKK